MLFRCHASTLLAGIQRITADFLGPRFSQHSLMDTTMLLHKLSTFLLPYTCILCNQTSDRDQDLCAACFHTLPPSHEQEALFIYEPPVTKIILDLKFKHNLSHARVLGELLSDHLQQYYQTNTKPQAIIPIPLHNIRLKERGFNQALEIARPAAHRLKVPLVTKKILRIKPTKAQATLSKSERTQNMMNAFQIETSFKHIAVIDDVITTGHTMQEFCQTLKANGVEQIDIWCIAKPRV